MIWENQVQEKDDSVVDGFMGQHSSWVLELVHECMDCD